MEIGTTCQLEDSISTCPDELITANVEEPPARRSRRPLNSVHSRTKSGRRGGINSGWGGCGAAIVTVKGPIFTFDLIAPVSAQARANTITIKPGPACVRETTGAA